MKKKLVKGLAITLSLSGAFALGMWTMYWIMWTDVLFKFLEMVERVFQ